jgi:hypothetical protein
VEAAVGLLITSHAGDGGARAADPAALHDGNLLARTAQMPCEQLSALAAAEDYDVNVFGLSHDHSNLIASSVISALVPWRIAALARLIFVDCSGLVTGKRISVRKIYCLSHHPTRRSLDPWRWN